MLVYDNASFEARRYDADGPFVIQIVAKGSVLDTEFAKYNEYFHVETVTIRVNQAVLQAWDKAQYPDDPPEYDYHGLPLDEYNRLRDWRENEYKRRKAEREKRQKEFDKRIQTELGIDTTRESYAISQIVSEFFTIVTMRKLDKIP